MIKHFSLYQDLGTMFKKFQLSKIVKVVLNFSYIILLVRNSQVTTLETGDQISYRYPHPYWKSNNPNGINYQKLGDKKRLIRDLTRPSHAIPSTQSTLHTKYSLFHDPPLNEFKPILEEFSSSGGPRCNRKYSYEDENWLKNFFGA